MGYGAEGAAGNIGSWNDYLLAIRPNTLLRVKKHGGYKTPAYYLFFGEDVVRIEAEEIEIWLDTQPNHYAWNAEKPTENFVSI